MKCKVCGADLPQYALFCGNCGTAIDNESSQKKKFTSDSGSDPYSNGEKDQNKVCPPDGSAENVSDLFPDIPGADNVRDETPKESILKNTEKNKKKKDENKKDARAVLTVIISCLSIIAVILLSLLVIVILDKSGIIEVNLPGFLSSHNSVNETQELDKNDKVGIDDSQLTPDSEPTPIPVPVFSNVNASSTRGTDYTSGAAVNYYPEYAIDDSYSTAWSSDRNVELTPTLELTASEPQYVTGVRVANGYFKSETTYTRNRRITKFMVEYEGGRVIVDCGIDQYRIMQDVKFDAPVWTNYIRIQVLETYYGDWKDIAISEVEVY